MTCTFLGHSDCPPTIIHSLKVILKDLIVNHGVDQFYVGNHGSFDFYVSNILKDLKKQYPHIEYYVVLAYVPDNSKKTNNDTYHHDTILPEGIERAPKRFAISYRNRWMVEQADYVVTYITRSFGGAAKFAELADRKNKICINLGTTM